MRKRRSVSTNATDGAQTTYGLEVQNLIVVMV